MIFVLMYLDMKISWFFRFIFLIKKFKDSIDLLPLIEDNRSHYGYIKDFNRFMFHKTKIKIKNSFVKVVYNALVVKIRW